MDISTTSEVLPGVEGPCPGEELENAVLHQPSCSFSWREFRQSVSLSSRSKLDGTSHRVLSVPAIQILTACMGTPGMLDTSNSAQIPRISLFSTSS
jgi:hypothetical protein